MAKTALIILAEGFEETEAIACIDVLRRANIEVTIAGLQALAVKGSHKIKITADYELDKITGDFDALILPGGMPGAMNLAASERVRSLILKLADSGKIIAAICASPALVLSPAGILKNKTATCYPGMQSNFDKTTKYKDETVVIDGNIITSPGPGSALLFAVSIAEKLLDKDICERLKKDLLIS